MLLRAQSAGANDEPRTNRELLLEIVARLGAIEAVLARSAKSSGPRDHADVAVLQAIAVSARNRSFTSRGLIRHAEIDANLAAALEAADLINAQQVGKLLDHLQKGGAVGNLRVERLEDKKDRDGITWRVVRV